MSRSGPRCIGRSCNGEYKCLNFFMLNLILIVYLLVDVLYRCVDVNVSCYFRMLCLLFGKTLSLSHCNAAGVVVDRTREETEEDGQTGLNRSSGVGGRGGIVTEGGLEVGVQPGTLKLVYGNGTGDCFWRSRVGSSDDVPKVREERMRR